MTRPSRLFAGLLLLALATGCFRPDRRVLIVQVPQMNSPACYAIIVESLKSMEGIESVRPDYDARTLEVTFNALRLAIKNVEHAVASTGFDANELKGNADAKARLPEGCR
ncbi:MAG TPA: cation transporter [Kiritimatiellia bacterium]|nr:cation transporter [Kiritimatiellia bacterium]